MGPPLPPRTRKYRVLRLLLRAGNAQLRFLQERGCGPAAFALLETTGRRSGAPHRTPVGNGLASPGSDVFWLVAAHGRQSDLVRNVEVDPRVRLRVGRGRWRTGTAVPLPDDDTVARSRTLPHRWDAALGRAFATTPLTVRIDLDPADRY